jgi:hypothetical protein
MPVASPAAPLHVCREAAARLIRPGPRLKPYTLAFERTDAAMTTDEKEALLNAIRRAAEANSGTRLTRENFLKTSGLKLAALLRHFPRWSVALAAAGINVHPYNQRIPPDDLLGDWGQLTRLMGRIPTRNEYKLEGSYSPGVFERNFGPWSRIPEAFRTFALSKPEWSDVVALLPANIGLLPPTTGQAALGPSARTSAASRNPRLADRPTYGDPIDFRGLRHEPVNEDGVVFLFGMVARELGYLVEAVQAGFPDCEAKRQIAAGKWQRVGIEFEFESRNFREHGHPTDGCDIIVCWRHNWAECPANLEVVELASLILTLPDADE